MSKPEHKTRRSHRKSRYGCTKCKGRRIKCDELAPRCSRCERMNLTCHYPKNRDWIEVEISRSYSRADGMSTSSPEIFDYSPVPMASPVSSGSGLGSPLESPAAQSLAPVEFNLLEHYLEHTSMDPSVDSEDQYTLQIGIPHLACQSKPLMRSVLALAAMCKCCDIINKPTSGDERGQVVALLSLAHQYHLESMREIQVTLHEAKNYDHILANAAMMGMYGSGSHCARIWLAKTATLADQVPCHLMPDNPQWISLFRAVRLAYAGLLNDQPQVDDTAQLRPSVETCSNRTQFEANPSSQPGALLHHPLAPIMAATVGSALSKLNEKASIVERYKTINPEDLQACLAALSIFHNIVGTTFPSINITPGHFSISSIPRHINIEPPTPVVSLPGLSLWMRRYTASISSVTPSPLPRRTVMSFVHKVPSKCLALIEEVMRLVEERPGEPSSGSRQELSVAHQLALEIFAHWLVLVMLLDDVWWIKGIGVWELGKVVDAVRKDGRWQRGVWGREGEEWWPGSMWEIARLFEMHR